MKMERKTSSIVRLAFAVCLIGCIMFAFEVVVNEFT